MTASIAELVAARAADASTGLRFEGRAWTWSEFVAESAARAAWLTEQRDPGRPFHVGVLLENVPDFAFLLAGAALAGAVVVGVNPTRRGEELATDVRHTDCQLLVTETQHLPLIEGLDLGLPADRIVNVDDPSWAPPPAPLPAELPGPDTLFVLFFTSGSTGTPKAVRASQGRYAAAGANMPFQPHDVLYCSMPLFHGNALASCFVPALNTGATLVLRRRFSASAFLEDVRSEGATFFTTVGRALSYILATPPTEHDRDHKIAFALGPESSPADVAEFRKRFGVHVVSGGYSSSEGAITITPAGTMRPGALGRPAAGQDLAIVDQATGAELPRARFDDAGALVNAGECIGELVRRDSDIRFEGYYDNPGAEAERTRGGWYWSGDLAYRDEDGIFYFAGRTADWIRVDGENFATAPIERIIGRHPRVGGVAVYGVPDPATSDRVMAAIEWRGDREHDFDPEEFAAFLAAQPDLGTKWAPSFVRLVDELPTTGADKLNKRPLRAESWETDDPVWWFPGRGKVYERLGEDGRSALRSGFEQHGRAALAPAKRAERGRE